MFSEQQGDGRALCILEPQGETGLVTLNVGMEGGSVIVGQEVPVHYDSQR